MSEAPPPEVHDLPRMLIASRRELRRLIGHLEVRTWEPLGLMVACVTVASLLAFVPEHTGLSVAGRWAMFIVVLAAGLWVTEAIPAFAVGLLVISLEIATLGRVGGPWAQGPDDWKVFIEPWGSPLIWLFFGGFVLARGIQRSGLDRSLSLRVLRRFGTRPPVVLLGAMGVTFAFSMFASNTATAAMMLAVLGPAVAGRPHDPFTKALLLGVAFAANIGGMATIIGTPPNAIAAGLLAERDPIGFARWMTLGLPPALVLLVVAWAYLVRRHPSRERTVDLGALASPTGAPPVMPRWRRGVVVLGLLATVGLWLTEPLHGASPPVVAFVPVALFTVSKVLVSDDIRKLEWDVLLLLAGGLALGVAVARTDLATWLVGRLPLEAAGPLALTAALAATTMVVSNFMSNTAAANLVIPMGMALATGAETTAAVAVALSASAAMCLPVSTPPNALAYAGGGLQTRDFLVGGSLIGVLAVALAVGWTALLTG
jgi:solute carrier family 13 (sodium-dependent dicarboxylate transporter), member 2/3/5